MEQEEGGHAAGRVAAARGGGLDERVGRAADAEVAVPERDVARVGAGDVDFDEDAAGEDVGDGEEHVGELRDADVPAVADFDHLERGVGVLEVAACGRDGGPDLADHDGAGGEEKGVGHNVDAVREEQDLASGIGRDDGVEIVGVIRTPVSVHWITRHRFDVDELSDVVFLVCSRSESQILATGEQTCGPVRGVNRTT